MNVTGRVGQRFGEFYSEVSWLPQSQWEGGSGRGGGIRGELTPWVGQVEGGGQWEGGHRLLY